MFEGGTSGIFRFVVKSDIPGYNWPFLTIFDFAIIFHYLLGVIIFSTTTHVGLYSYFFILTYRINTMDLKSQKKHKIREEKVRSFHCKKQKYV